MPVANKRVFKTAYLKDELNLPYEAISDYVYHVSRWSIQHRIVFMDTDGTYWQTEYSVGATEMQHEGPWEWVDEVTAVEVEFKEVTRKQWVIKE